MTINIILKINEIQEQLKICLNLAEYCAEFVVLRKIINQTFRTLNETGQDSVSPVKTQTFLCLKEKASFYINYASAAIRRLKKLDSAELKLLLNNYKKAQLLVQLSPEPEYTSIAAQLQIERAPLKNTEFKDQNAPIRKDFKDLRTWPSVILNSVSSFFSSPVSVAEAYYALELANECRIFSGQIPIIAELARLEGNCEPVHEVLNEYTRFFCDLDDKENIYSREKFIKLINLIASFFEEFFKAYYDIQGQLFINFYVAISDTIEYNSAHMYIDIFNCQFEQYAVSGQGQFWAEFSRNLGARIGHERKLCLDLAVYRQNGQFRLPNTRKNGYLLRPIFQEIYEIEGQNNSAQYERTYNIFNDKGTARKELASETLICDAADTRRFVRKMAEPHHFSANLTKIGLVKKLKPRAIKMPVKLFTGYEQQLFLDCLAKSGLTFDNKKVSSNKNSLVNGAIYRIHCFFYFQPAIKQIEIANKFFAAKKVNLPRGYIEERINTFIKAETYSAFSFESYMKFFKFLMPNEICVSEECFKYPNWQGVLLLKSGTGTGKTYGFLQKVKGARSLFISNRISLSEEFLRTAKNLGINMVSYKDKEVNILEKRPDYFACQINSLYKYISILDSYEYIFIDESEALLEMITHVCETNAGTLPVLKNIFRNIIFKPNKKVVLCSANLGYRTINFVESFKVPYFFIRNTVSDKAGYRYVRCGTAKFFYNLKQKVEIGEKSIIATATKEDAKRIEAFLNGLDQKPKVLLQTSDTEKINVENWIYYDVVIHTSTIECGVSVNYEHFHNIFGFFKSGVITFSSAFQMLFRVRRPLNKDIFIWTTKSSLDRPDLVGNEMATRIVEMKKSNGNPLVSKEDREKIYHEFIFKQAKCPIDRQLINNQLFKNYSDSYFSKLLIRELEGAGLEPFNGYDEPKDFVLEGIKVKKTEAYLDPLCESKMREFLGYYGDLPNDVLKKAVSYKNILDDNKLDSYEHSAKLLLNIFKGFEDSETKINTFIEQNFNALSACMNNRKYSKKEFMGKMMKYKVQSINAVIKKTGIALKKEKSSAQWQIETDPAFVKIFK